MSYSSFLDQKTDDIRETGIRHPAYSRYGKYFCKIMFKYGQFHGNGITGQRHFGNQTHAGLAHIRKSIFMV